MLSDPPPLTRNRYRRPPRVTATPPAPAAPTLVAAEWEEGVWVRLTFDRAVAIGDMDPATVTVNDGLLSETTYTGVGPATLVSATIVEIPIEAGEPFAGGATTLDVVAGNGIVAADGGAAWAGASGVGLPFP